MKLKFILPFIAGLIFAGCAGQNESVIEAIKDNSLAALEGQTVRLSDVIFDDWAYPDIEGMQTLFPDNQEYWELSYGALRYHGVKIIIEDLENIPYEYDESDGSYYYESPEQYKIIAFFPRSSQRLVNKFKRLYVSKDHITLTGEFLFVLPGEVWTDVQIREDDMPVLMLKSAR